MSNTVYEFTNTQNGCTFVATLDEAMDSLGDDTVAQIVCNEHATIECYALPTGYIEPSLGDVTA